MVIFVRKEKKHLVVTTIGKLAFITLIIALASAMINTVWSAYIDSFVNNTAFVGFISGSLTIIGVISYFYFIPLIEKSNKSRLYKWTLFLFVVCYILIAINKVFYIFLILAFILTALVTLRITCFGIIVRDKSSEKKLCRNEGLMYTAMNFSYLIGPLLAGYIAELIGVKFIFILAGFLVFIALLVFKFSGIKDGNVKREVDSDIRKNFFAFFKDKHRVIAYFLSGGINFWFILIYIYMPLFILNNGLSERWIGYFLFGIALPAVLIQYKLAEKTGKVGFKKIFKIGFLLPCIFAIACFFVSQFYLIFLFLIIGTIGIAMLEPVVEAYFFDILKNKKEELRFYGPYNTSIDSNQFLAEILSGIILLYLPFKFVFLFFGGAMFIFFLLTFATKNVIEQNKT